MFVLSLVTEQTAQSFLDFVDLGPRNLLQHEVRSFSSSRLVLMSHCNNAVDNFRPPRVPAYQYSIETG